MFNRNFRRCTIKLTNRICLDDDPNILLLLYLIIWSWDVEFMLTNSAYWLHLLQMIRRLGYHVLIFTVYQLTLLIAQLTRSSRTVTFWTWIIDYHPLRSLHCQYGLCRRLAFLICKFIGQWQTCRTINIGIWIKYNYGRHYCRLLRYQMHHIIAHWSVAKSLWLPDYFDWWRISYKNFSISSIIIRIKDSWVPLGWRL